MPVTHFDIDDQYNKQNIEAAKRVHEEQLQWDKKFSKDFKGYKYLCALPEDDDEAIEI